MRNDIHDTICCINFQFKFALLNLYMCVYCIKLKDYLSNIFWNYYFFNQTSKVRDKMRDISFSLHINENFLANYFI